MAAPWDTLTVPALHAECRRRGLGAECKRARLKSQIVELLDAYDKSQPSVPNPVNLVANGLVHTESQHLKHIELTSHAGETSSYQKVLDTLDQHLKAANMTRAEAEQVIGTAASWLKGIADSLELEEARETSVAPPPPTRVQRFNQAAQMAAKVAVGSITAAATAAQLLPAAAAQVPGGAGDTGPDPSALHRRLALTVAGLVGGGVASQLDGTDLAIAGIAAGAGGFQFGTLRAGLLSFVTGMAGTALLKRLDLSPREWLVRFLRSLASDPVWVCTIIARVTMVKKIVVDWMHQYLVRKITELACLPESVARHYQLVVKNDFDSGQESLLYMAAKRIFNVATLDPSVLGAFGSMATSAVGAVGSAYLGPLAGVAATVAGTATGAAMQNAASDVLGVMTFRRIISVTNENLNSLLNMDGTGELLSLLLQLCDLAWVASDDQVKRWGVLESIRNATQWMRPPPFPPITIPVIKRSAQKKEFEMMKSLWDSIVCVETPTEQYPPPARAALFERRVVLTNGKEDELQFSFMSVDGRSSENIRLSPMIRVVEMLNPHVRLRWLFDLNADLWTPKIWCGSDSKSVMNMYDDAVPAHRLAETLIGKSAAMAADVTMKAVHSITEGVHKIVNDFTKNDSIVGFNVTGKTAISDLLKLLKRSPHWKSRAQIVLKNTLKAGDISRYIAMTLFVDDINMQLDTNDADTIHSPSVPLDMYYKWISNTDRWDGAAETGAPQGTDAAKP